MQNTGKSDTAVYKMEESLDLKSGFSRIKKIFTFKAAYLLILPALYVLIFLIYPLAGIFVKSIYNGHLTGEYYYRFFTDTLYLQVLWLTLKTGFIVTLMCILLGYPVAYTMTFMSKRGKGFLMIAILIPFWTSLLVRSYAWMVLLQTQGVINKFLMYIGVIHEPIKLIYNSIGVVIGMTHALLPYMILSLYSVMQSIDKNLLSASENLGARPFTTFRKVFLPLSVKGIASGSVLVFIMSIGYFITPSLLGGEKDTMISQLIQTQVSQLLNWGFGSAIAFVLLAVTLILLLVSKKFLKLDKIM
jgi:putative spermidine/putrescine transport system permease protein/spermidine/putrescine transport system permease protein